MDKWYEYIQNYPIENIIVSEDFAKTRPNKQVYRRDGMIKAELIDKTGDVIAVVRQTEDWEHSLGGIISLATSWSLSDSTYGEEFFAHCNIKWDGCSHFWYYGQDFPYDEEIYPYYHECGLDYYYKQFVAKLFAFEVAKYYMKDDAKHMDNDLYNTIDRVNILDFYEIKYSEVDLDNDYFYISCLEKLKE